MLFQGLCDSVPPAVSMLLFSCCYSHSLAPAVPSYCCHSGFFIGSNCHWCETYLPQLSSSPLFLRLCYSFRFMLRDTKCTTSFNSQQAAPGPDQRMLQAVLTVGTTKSQFLNPSLSLSLQFLFPPKIKRLAG